MEKMLKDRVAIVTGSGRGIGRAVALLLAREGAKVVVSDIDPAPAQETAGEIKNFGGESLAHAGDVTKPEFAEGIVKKAVDAWGGLHILVNNAGFTWDAVIHKMTDQQWEAMLGVHLTAPFRLIRAAAPYFREAAKKEKEAGKVVNRKIINVSSIAGISPDLLPIYSISKAAVIMATKVMAQQWAQYNIRANCVAPGLTKTKFSEALWNNPDILKHAMAFTPMGRVAEPEEMVGAILFLASDASSYVTGQVIAVDGGKTI